MPIDPKQYTDNRLEKVLQVQHLTISFKTDHGILHAVRDVSFDLYKGETLCIVGESGSGKSVTSKAIMGILAKNAIVEGGHIYYQGEDLLQVSEDEFHTIRGHKIGMIFQDPLSSLDPIVKIGKQLTEATLVNNDKLKRYYEELISKELIAYKNALARRDFALKAEEDKFNEKKAETEEKIKSGKLSSSEKNSLKAALKEAERAKKAKEKEIKANSKEEVKPLKKALAQREKEAKKEVAAYKKKVEKDYKDKVEAIDSNASLSPKEKREKRAEAKKEKVNSLKITRAEAKRRALEIMKEVGIPQPEKRYKQYPFEFSGGMRQRIVIAIALTETPDILICDEPTTALDVTIQAQILELIKRLQKERNLSVIFITHDLGVVANMADRVAVMYAGKIVEYGTAREIFFEPKHPYTWALLSSIPDVDSKEKLEAIPGTPPDMIYPPKGDAFAARDRYAMQIDYEEQPPYFQLSPTHYAATWLLHPDAPKVVMPKIVSERIRLELEEEAAKKAKAAEAGKEESHHAG